MLQCGLLLFFSLIVNKVFVKIQRARSRWGPCSVLFPLENSVVWRVVTRPCLAPSGMCERHSSSARTQLSRAGSLWKGEGLELSVRGSCKGVSVLFPAKLCALR